MKRILIVDDDPIREVIKDCLVDLGVREEDVSLAESLAVARALVEVHPSISVIVLDGRVGDTIAQTIKFVEEVRRLRPRIRIMSIASYPKDVRAMFAAGCEAHSSKPDAPREVFRMLGSPPRHEARH